MGGGGDPEGDETPCAGEDVKGALEDVFGNPKSDKYQNAKKAALDKFANVRYLVLGNWQDLYDAYTAAFKAAPRDMPLNWDKYLQALGTLKGPDGNLGPLNISTIANYRQQCLQKDIPMHITTHDPTQDGDHNVHPEPQKDGSILIDSPWTPPNAALKRNRNRKPK
jgi:hypothetical protein